MRYLFSTSHLLEYSFRYLCFGKTLTLVYWQKAQLDFIFWCFICSQKSECHYSVVSPYNDDDAVKHVVGVSQVAEGTKRCDFEDHLQREHAGEDNVADLQNIS